MEKQNRLKIKERTSAKIDPSLNKFKNTILFPKKVALAQKILSKVQLPTQKEMVQEKVSSKIVFQFVWERKN